MNTIFDFNQHDKSLLLTEAFPDIKNVSDLNISEKKYKNCQMVEFHYYNGVWKETIDEDKVKEFNFDSLQDYQETYIKCLLYGSIIYSKKTLNEFLLHLYNKSQRFSDYKIPEIPKYGNIIDYFMTYKLESLLACGL